MSRSRSRRHRGRNATGNTCASPPDRTFTSYQDVVDSYLQEERPRAEEEFAFFQDKHWAERCPDLRTAIRFAALSMRPDGKRRDHQRRIPGGVLAQAEKILQSTAAALTRCRSFAELHDRIAGLIGPIHGIGDVAVYDIATRIGAYLGLEPELVYLHAGVTEGAKALNLSLGRKTLHPSELPAPFQVLRPRELEDCLCIFKDVLATIQQAPSPKPSLGAIHPRIVRRTTRQWSA